MTKEEFYSRALSFDEVGEQVDIFKKEKIEYEQEIERLNNIINELEHHLYQEWLEWKDSDCESIYSRAGEDKAIYDYLQELKGSDSNVKD